MPPRKKANGATPVPPPAPPIPSPTPASSAALIPDASPYGAVLRPLRDVVAVLTGKFPTGDYTSHGIHYLLNDLGAGLENRVMNRVTHVIASREDYLANATKVRNGLEKGIPVVRAAWVTECDRTQTLVDVKTHTWSYIYEEEERLYNARNDYRTGQANGDKKRPIAVANPNGADVEEDAKEEEEEPKPKKTRTARGKKEAVKDEDEPMEDAEEEEEEEEEEAAKDTKVADGQIIKQKGAVIPVDSFCHLTGYKVYIDPKSGMIYDASLNQTNASNNNNKFYIVQLLHEPNTNQFSTWTRWGRVGEPGANATLGDGSFTSASSQFQKKFRDKSGLLWENRTAAPKAGKYAFVERSYEPDSEDDEDAEEADNKTQVKEEEEPEPDCTLEEPTRKLMEMIFNTGFMQATMQELNYDADKLPLGKLSKSTILRGFEQLKALSALFDDPSLAASQHRTSLGSATENLSNAYYSLIPHAFGRQRPPIISDERRLKREVELLESLSDMKIAADLMKADRKPAADPVHHLDRKFQSLNMDEMTPLKHTTKEFKTLQKYLCGTVGATHSVDYEVIDIFRIERHGEKARFASSSFADIASDKRLLWHGSRCTNFGGILSQGLRIAPPEAPVSGYMFGKGIYLADMSSKSAGYCCSSMSNNEGLLLLCEAELGDPMLELTHSSYTADEEAKKAGSWSTKGQGSIAPNKWMDAGAVHKTLKGVQMPDPSSPAQDTNIPGTCLYYNEYICYDTDQVQLRYLFRVKM